MEPTTHSFLPLTEQNIRDFLQRLSTRCTTPTVLHLVGGGALLLLGNQRMTGDLDYVGEDLPTKTTQFQQEIQCLADEMQIEVEAVPIERFIPLPDGFATRHQLVEQYGLLEVYVFDPYTIALSKIDRGFESDLEDVRFLLQRNLVDIDLLDGCVNQAIQHANAFDIVPADIRAHFQALKQLLQG